VDKQSLNSLYGILVRGAERANLREKGTPITFKRGCANGEKRKRGEAASNKTKKRGNE